jgi:Bardet-Biedl syndrome 2 protein
MCRDLLTEHEKRAQNHAELLDGLKRVNQMIQQAARLRVGGAATKVVAACRAAVKANNMQALVKVVRGGAEEGIPAM